MIRGFRRSVSPSLAVALTVLWLLLNQTLAPGHILLGIVLSVLLAWAGSTLRPLRARLSRIDLAATLLMIVIADMVRSNFDVARIVLGLTGSREVEAGFVDIPMELQDPHGLALLAMILTATPGAVWVGMSPDRRWLRLHVLDLVDESYWIRVVKQRYERRLKGIFE